MPKKTAPNTDAASTDPLFAPVIKALSSDRSVTQGKMFGSTGLKVGGKVFAMIVKGWFVAKLPADRVQELIGTGKGDYFDPGHGRVMKEWVSMPPATKAIWVKLAQEAKEFVSSK